MAKLEWTHSYFTHYVYIITYTVMAKLEWTPSY